LYKDDQVTWTLIFCNSWMESQPIVQARLRIRPGGIREKFGVNPPLTSGKLSLR
jgi:hypothetical protein